MLLSTSDNDKYTHVDKTKFFALVMQFYSVVGLFFHFSLEHQITNENFTWEHSEYV